MAELPLFRALPVRMPVCRCACLWGRRYTSSNTEIGVFSEATRQTHRLSEELRRGLFVAACAGLSTDVFTQSSSTTPDVGLHCHMIDRALASGCTFTVYLLFVHTFVTSPTYLDILILIALCHYMSQSLLHQTGEEGIITFGMLIILCFFYYFFMIMDFGR